MYNEKLATLSHEDEIKIEIGLRCYNSESIRKSWALLSREVLSSIADDDDTESRQSLVNALNDVDRIVGKYIAGEYENIKRIVG